MTEELLDFRDFSSVQWLGLHTPRAGGEGSIPAWGTKIPHAAWCSQKKKKKKQQQQPKIKPLDLLQFWSPELIFYK